MRITTIGNDVEFCPYCGAWENKWMFMRRHGSFNRDSIYSCTDCGEDFIVADDPEYSEEYCVDYYDE